MEGEVGGDEGGMLSMAMVAVAMIDEDRSKGRGQSRRLYARGTIPLGLVTTGAVRATGDSARRLALIWFVPTHFVSIRCPDNLENNPVLAFLFLPPYSPSPSSPSFPPFGKHTLPLFLRQFSWSVHAV